MMRVFRWVLAAAKRDKALWRCIDLENEYAFLLACGDKDKITKHKAALDAARCDYDQLIWSNI